MITQVIRAADAGTRRASLAVAFFGTWMIGGLFLDGWAHQVEKPETFFSPWHGVLYSGFIGAVAWFAWAGRHGSDVSGGIDRLANVGLGLFVVGAIGDGIWHSIFGIEVSTEALLSPTHLALMVGGALMVSAPIRVASPTVGTRPPLRELGPTLVSLTLVTGVALFFLMNQSAATPIAGANRRWEPDQIRGVSAVIIRTAILLGAMFFVLRRWRPPAGTFTILFTASAVALAGLEGFDAIALAAPFALGGAVADAIAVRGLEGRHGLVLGSVVPLVCWLGYFGVHTLVWGVHWPAEIWTGSVIFSVLTGVALAVISAPAAEGPVRFHG